MDRARVAVVGAGIAGLSAAHRITQLGSGDVLLLESTGRLGGKVQTIDVGGMTVEAGPDSFITRNPHAQQLCAELGLSTDLVGPAALGALLWLRQGLRPLPKDMTLGVPVRLGSVVSSGAVSPLGVVRAACERFLPVRPPNGDVSVGQLIRPRFGDEVFESVVDPLLSGIYAGNADRLSAESTVPHLLDALRRGRRLSSLEPPAAAGPGFLTVRGGLRRLIDSIATTLPAHAVRLGSTAVALDRDASGYRITLESGDTICSEAVVLATPPAVAASLLGSLSGPASRLLASIEAVPIATVTMKFSPGAISPRDSTGFLVPRTQNRLLVGCTFVTRKWPHLASGGAELVRCAVGRDGDNRWQKMEDGELVHAVRQELDEAAGIGAPPEAVAVSRFADGMPQYRVGHVGLVDRIERELDTLPRLALAGAAYRGVGLPACIASGRRAAEAAARGLEAAVA